MNENLLLRNSLARDLFEMGRDLPLIDWHNHLSVTDIADDRRFGNLADLWVKSDPYKHRAMRICGIPERLITGEASDLEKFHAWAQTLPALAGNPLYHWSEMELKRGFDIETPLTPDTADSIWNEANEKLLDRRRSARGFLSLFNVEYAAPCVTLCDSLVPFEKMPTGIVPSLRGDDIVAPTRDFLQKLADLTGKQVNEWQDFQEALSARLEALHLAKCRFADHALDCGFFYVASDGKEHEHFRRILDGSEDNAARDALRAAILRFLASEYARLGWTMQLHIGACRNTSSRLRKVAGPAGGYAAIGHTCDILSLTRMLDDFEHGPSGLPRILLYTLNPADNAAFTVLTGSYSQDGVTAKVQAGPAWWFCDHLQGMRDSFEHQAAYGVLSTFVGMTTDSRSLLSFTRHEYFRRAFCAWLADKVAMDELPADRDLLAGIVRNVFYHNARRMIPDAPSSAR